MRIHDICFSVSEFCWYCLFIKIKTGIIILLRAHTVTKTPMANVVLKIMTSEQQTPISKSDK